MKNKHIKKVSIINKKTNRIILTKICIIVCLSAVLFLLPSVLPAHELTLGIMAGGGRINNEREPRINRDDMIVENRGSFSTGGLMNTWEKKTAPGADLFIQYIHQLGTMGIIGAAQAAGFGGKPVYTSIGYASTSLMPGTPTMSALSFYETSLKNFRQIDERVNTGIEFSFLDRKLRLAGLFGRMRHGYYYKEKFEGITMFSFGSSTFPFPSNSVGKIETWASAIGNFVGLQMQFRAVDSFTILARYITAPSLKGNFSYENFSMGPFSQDQSYYRVSIQSYQGGVQYNFNARNHLILMAVVNESGTRYPGYHNTYQQTLALTPGLSIVYTTNTSEALSNYLINNHKFKFTDKAVFLGYSHDFVFGE